MVTWQVFGCLYANTAEEALLPTLGHWCQKPRSKDLDLAHAERAHALRARTLCAPARCASSRRTEAPTSDPSDSEGSRAPRVRDVRSAFHGHGVNCMSVCISTTFDRREYGCPHLLIEARRSFPLSVWIP